MNKDELWNNYLKCYDALNSFDDYSNYLDEITTIIGAGINKKILDAGSGTGNCSLKMKATGADVLSIDYCTAGLKIHKEKDPDAEQMQLSLEEPLPLSADSFDGIVCTSVLFSLSPEGTKTALKEFRRVLKKNGTLIITAGKPESSKMKSFLMYFARMFDITSAKKTIYKVANQLIPALKVLYYNYRMFKLNDTHKCQRFEKDVLIDIVSYSGFNNLQYKSTMGNLMHMIVCNK